MFAIKRWLDRLSLWQTIYGLVTSQVASVYVVAPALTMWAFISGWGEQLSTPYLLASCAFLFGSINWGFLQFSIWRERERMDSKLRLVNVSFESISDRLPDGLVSVSAVQFILEFQSIASFPIRFRLKLFSSDFDRVIPAQNWTPIEGTSLSGRSTVLIGPVVRLDAPKLVKASDTALPALFRGNLQFCLNYGRGNNLKHEINHKISIALKVDPRDNPPLSFSWRYADDDASLLPY